jgi:hypothetical protein
MMPWAAHGIIDDEPLAERPVVVRAMRSNSEDLCAAAHHQHLLVADVTDQFAAVDEPRERYSSRQIGTAGRRLILGHSPPELTNGGRQVIFVMAISVSNSTCQPNRQIILFRNRVDVAARRLSA